MTELGAPRLDAMPPPRKRGRARKGAIAHFGMNEKLVVLHIPAASKLLKRFRTPNGKAAAHWKFSLRPSVDLQAPPLLVVKQADVPPGKKVQGGLVAGFNVSGAWRLTMGRSVFPALDQRVEFLPTVGLTLYEDNGTELVFQMPPGTLPTGFTKHPTPPVEQPPAAEALAPQPQAAPAPAAAPQLVVPNVMFPDQPLNLQLPKQGVSIETAITVLNKAKARLGNNLRFTIEENGFLSAVHRIGK